MTLLTRTLHKQNMLLAEKLKNWLNSKKPNPHRKRIAQIIESLNALRLPRKKLRSVKPGTFGLPDGAEFETLPYGQIRPIFKTLSAIKWFLDLEALKGVFRDCGMHPQLVGETTNGWKLEWRPQSDFARYLYPVIRLAEYGQIIRVRRCLVCKKWFVATRRLDQSCCKLACQKKRYDHSPEGKRVKREYMKVYMARRRKEGK
jgi:hypothetical protein